MSDTQAPSKDLVRDLRILAANFGAVTAQYIRDAADEIERLQQVVADCNHIIDLQAKRLNGGKLPERGPLAQEPILSYEEFFRLARETGWNPTADELRELLITAQPPSAGQRFSEQEVYSAFDVPMPSSDALDPPRCAHAVPIDPANPCKGGLFHDYSGDQQPPRDEP